ncbi:MAG: Lrp/AsnC family transcriptional regulator [Pseudomonadota bacterium]
MSSSDTVDEIDHALIRATQNGLPLTPHPYRDIGLGIGLGPDDVEQRLQRLQDIGVIRRIGIIPNHYRLGYRANGMSVWDVADDRVDDLGFRIGALHFVSHCYRRPRHLPDWPFNLFAMIHATTRDEIDARIADIAGILGESCRSHRVLFSEKILKKTGLRLPKPKRCGARPCSD